jgi:hypothetical protein
MCRQLLILLIATATGAKHSRHLSIFNLISSQVLVWNRSPEKCAALVADGAVAVDTPAAAVEGAAIVYGMLADPKAALEVGGVLLVVGQLLAWQLLVGLAGAIEHGLRSEQRLFDF